MTLRELFSEAGVVPARLEGDAPFRRMTMDSRKAAEGTLFVAWPSKSGDSHGYLEGAKAAGATCAIAFTSEGFEQARKLGLAAALVPAEEYEDAMWRLAKVAFGNPTSGMKVVGVTGTNGKTTTAWLLRDMLRTLGVKAGYLGTLGFQTPSGERELNNTTPFVIELNELLAEARDEGVEALAIEVSSHALQEKRADGIEFDAGVFTNLTQDHLDFHGTMEAYAAAKLRLFTELPKQSSKRFVAAIHRNDPTGQRWLGLSGQSIQTPMLSFRVLEKMEQDLGLDDEAAGRPYRLQIGNLFGYPHKVGVDRIEMSFLCPETHAYSGRLEIPLGGAYNVENCLSAAAGILALGYSILDIRQALPQVRPVPGRFEAVRNEKGIGVLVDYAHTPDALEKLLDAVRPLTKGRIITVFGCGGDRDSTKRPKMAKAASQRSDLTVATSDNPRTEDPQAILNEVVSGIVSGRESVAIIDRREAIAHAVHTAKPGDVVVIAGKGHENYQIIGRTKYPMDDREMAREALTS